MEVYGIIYTLIDGTNDKEYVGQTTRTFAERFYQHVHGDLYIDRVMQKHGADLFATAILQICYSQEELDYWEKRLIKSRDTMSPNGYNLIEGGIGTTGKNNPFFGKRHTAESIARMSESHRGNTAWVGRKHRQDSKAKISAWRRTDTPFKNLLAEMDKRNMTYKNLAGILGMPRMTLPPKIRGIADFTAVEVIKLEKIFGLPAEYLMARDDGQIFSPSKNSPFKNLLIEMDKHKITYRKLAEILGLSESMASFKMSGKRNFTKKDIAKLEEIFGLPAEYLLQRDD